MHFSPEMKWEFSASTNTRDSGERRGEEMAENNIKEKWLEEGGNGGKIDLKGSGKKRRGYTLKKYIYTDV